MAVYTTFFVRRPEELLRGFPGWRLPLAKPVRRKLRNPLTGVEAVVETRVPEWPQGAIDESEYEYPQLECEYEAVEIKSEYEAYLEGRLRPFVRSCPHWAAKGLSSLELEPLLEAAGIAGSIETALYSPPSTSGVVEQFPTEFLARLGSLDHMAVAGRWAAAMSTPERTHSGTGIKLSDGLPSSEAESILNSIVSLARRTTWGQQIYLLTEW